MQSQKLLQQLFEKTFLLFWLTLPFGAHLFPISLGSFTIYPVLFFSIVGSFSVVLTFTHWNNYSKFILIFLLLWILQAMIQGYSIQTGKVEIRALIMQFIFFTNIVGLYYFLSKNQFFKLLKLGLRLILFTLLSFGVFEFFTGIHLKGFFTEKLEILPVSWTFYSPIFVYDNPNDYLAYLYFFLGILPLFDNSYRNKLSLQILLTLIAFVFSLTADARFGELIGGTLLLSQFSLVAWKYRQKIKLKIALPYVFMIVFSILILWLHPMFIGPKYKDGNKYRINELKVLSNENTTWKITDARDTLNIFEQKQVINQIDSLAKNNPSNSNNLRKNLIFNGLELIKMYPIFGSGPGGYAAFHIKNKASNFVAEHTSPHNLPIELVSQYGVSGWCYLLIIGVLFILLLKSEELSWQTKLNVALFGLMLPILWMMPSAYIYLKIHRLLLPLLLILALKKQNALIT